MSLANLSVKGEYEGVKNLLSSSGEEFYISRGSSDYVNIFPQTESFGSVSTLAQDFSKNLDTFTICGEVYDSDSVQVAFYSSGELIFTYEWYEQNQPVIKGDLKKLATFAVKEFDLNKFRDKVNERSIFAEDRYEDFLVPFGFSYALRETGYNYIESDSTRVGGLTEYNKDEAKLTVEKI